VGKLSLDSPDIVIRQVVHLKGLCCLFAVEMRLSIIKLQLGINKLFRIIAASYWFEV